MPSTSPKPECMECKKLPKPEQPATPRPIDPRSGPRSLRCHTHLEAMLKRQRMASSAGHQRRTYELETAEYSQLREAQHGVCPCGNRIKHTDHDHERARRLCAHDPKKGCKRCVRGLMCHNCNSYILGRGYDERRLLAIVAYLRNPPARQLWGD